MATRPTLAAGLALIFALAALQAPAGTKLEASGKTAGVGPAKKLLLVLVSPDLDRRKNWEEIFAGELALQGVVVIPSYRLFPELPKDRETATAKVAAEGFDSVLITNLVGIETKVKWKESETSLQPQYVGQDWYGSYWYTYQQVEVPGYMENKSRARFKCDYWRLDEGKGRIVWSGTSDSIDPGIKPQAGLDVITKITQALRKAGLI